MKKAIIYGEFLETSSTGIAYINSVLEESIIESKYQVTKIYEPRSKDYAFHEKKVIKKTHFFSFIKVLFKLILLKNHNISFITLSMGNLGLLKTLIIQFFLNIKTNKLYLYIHRGDLNTHYKKSKYKKFIINIILKSSFKIIFLSNKILDDFSIKAFDKKTIIIPNSLSKVDSLLSKKIFEIKKSNLVNNKKKQINLIYCGNIQKEKGIHHIINSILNVNKSQNKIKLNLDIYGIKFEEIPQNYNFIKYKGRLTKNNRLKIMSQYDFLITASITEGLPMTLIECLALGVPFITTSVGGISDLLVKNYPYICTHDTKSIIKNLNKMIFDFYNKKEYLSKLIIKGNEIYNKRFKFDKYISYIQKYIVDV